MRARGKKKAGLVKATKAPEVRYRRQLLQLVNRLKNGVKTRILPLLKAFEPQYTGDSFADSYATQLENAFDDIRKTYVDVNIIAKGVASQFVGTVNIANEKRFYASIEKVVGINVRNLIQNEGIGDLITSTTRNNVNLIVSIADEYMTKVENIVFTGVNESTPYFSMTKEIMKVNGDIEYKAKRIARDQTSKFNAALNQQRQTNLGVEEYVWRTVGDGDRVRKTHRANNGKTFRWDKPSKITGHPGHDIQCRCIAQPVINI